MHLINWINPEDIKLKLVAKGQTIRFCEAPSVVKFID